MSYGRLQEAWYMCHCIFQRENTHLCRQILCFSCACALIINAEVIQSCGHHKELPSLSLRKFRAWMFLRALTSNWRNGLRSSLRPLGLLHRCPFSGWVLVRWVPCLELCPTEQDVRVHPSAHGFQAVRPLGHCKNLMSPWQGNQKFIFRISRVVSPSNSRLSGSTNL